MGWFATWSARGCVIKPYEHAEGLEPNPSVAPLSPGRSRFV